jgi:hypothetical protein
LMGVQFQQQCIDGFQEMGGLRWREGGKSSNNLVAECFRNV